MTTAAELDATVDAYNRADERAAGYALSDLSRTSGTCIA
jgi:hypothetical protein